MSTRHPARVDVYRNLRTGLWSIRHRGRVLMHAEHVELRDVEFKVSEAGRRRAVREGRRNVHAVARGTVARIEGRRPPRLPTRVTYNPFRVKHFVDAVAQRPVHAAEKAFFGPDGAVFV